MSKGYYVTYEVVDYVHVINSALNETRRRRANIDPSTGTSLERTAWEYCIAVEALYVHLIPELRTARMRELLVRARKASGWEKVRLADQALELILEKLNQAGLLIRGERVEIEE